MFALLILAAIMFLIFLYFMTTYNSFIKLRNLAEEGWSGIDVQLKKRYDLIPNILETVKGYATHEKELFENVTKYRNMAIRANNIKDQQEAENMLSGTLKSLFAVSENYPELKANENFIQLQNTLKEIETGIEMARRYYNGTVRDLNIKCETFPSVIIANMFRFSKKEFFEIEESQKDNIKVNF